MFVLQLVYEGLAGGVLRVAIEYAKNMIKLNHKSLVITSLNLREIRSFFEFPTYAKLDISKIGILSSYIGGLLNQVAGKLSVNEVLKLIARKVPRIDWVLVHNLTPAKDAYYIAKKTKAKVAILIHNPTYPPSVTNYLTSTLINRPLLKSRAEAVKYLERADLVLAVHNYNVRLVKELYGINAISVPLGCNPSSWIPPRRGSYVLIPVRLSLGKKVDVLAKAVALASKDVKTIFVGAKHYTTYEVMKRIKKSGLCNYTIILNAPRKIFEKLFVGARVVIYGLSETDFLMPASYGAPIICGRKKYAGDILIDGVHGYLIDFNHEIPIEKYAKAIAKLLDNERLARKMGYNAWKEAWKYTWYRATQCLTQLLEQSA